MKKKLFSILLSLVMVISMIPAMSTTVFAVEDPYTLSSIDFVPAKGDTSPATANCANYKAYVILYDGTYASFTDVIASQGESGIDAMTKYQFDSAYSENIYRADWTPKQYFFDYRACSKTSFDYNSIKDITPVGVVFYGTGSEATEYCTFEVDSDVMEMMNAIGLCADPAGWQTWEKDEPSPVTPVIPDGDCGILALLIKLFAAKLIGEKVSETVTRAYFASYIKQFIPMSIALALGRVMFHALWYLH